MITAAEVIADIQLLDPDYVVPSTMEATINAIILAIPALSGNYYNGDTPGIAMLMAAAILEDAYDSCPHLRVLRLGNLTLHMVTLADKNNGSTADIQSYTEGDVAVTYGKSTAKQATLGLGNTSYGQEYDRLVRSCIFTPRTAGVTPFYYGRCTWF